MAWALVGSLMYILAYGYYTVAGVFPMPGSEAIVFLIEFGTVMASLILLAVVMGTCLLPPAGERALQHERTAPNDRDD